MSPTQLAERIVAAINKAIYDSHGVHWRGLGVTFTPIVERELAQGLASHTELLEQLAVLKASLDRAIPYVADKAAVMDQIGWASRAQSDLDFCRVALKRIAESNKFNGGTCVAELQGIARAALAPSRAANGEAPK